MAHPAQRYILKWSKMVTPKVKHLAFARETEEPISFIAGQFLTLNIQGPEKILHRSYSVANTPGENTLEIACAYVEGGVATNLLFNMQPGDSIQASGPFGLFVLKEEPVTRYIFIATGTGVTPYRSMLKSIQTKLNQKTSGHPLEVILILGVRNPDELLFGDEFEAFATQNPQFKFYACFSREGHPNLKPNERVGRIQELFPELNLKPDQDIVYLCGNPMMIDDTFALLTDLGFDKKSVRREKYLFSH